MRHTNHSSWYLAGLVCLGVLAMVTGGPAGAQEPRNLARLAGVVALAESEHRDRWGLDGWHASLAVDGNRDGSGEGARTNAWASDNWEYTHTLLLVFPNVVEASEVRVFWAAPKDTLTPRRFSIEGLEGGKWHTLASRENQQEEPATSVAFPACAVSAIRISQPPDGAHPAADRRLWIAEMEVYGRAPENAAPVPVAAVAEQVRADLAKRRAAEAEERARPQIALAMRVPKTAGYSGIIDREDLARGRQNIARHAWARAAADAVIQQASWWLEKSDEFVHSLVPVGNPRALCPSFEKGCPLHGGARNSFSASMDAPYRWKCKAGGEEWFDGAVVKNPGTGAETTVRDDGSGWLAPPGFPHAGRRTFFTAAYRYFLLGKLFGAPYEEDRGGGAPGSNAVHALSLAYAYTGDARYAHKAGILLNRLAEVYRFYDGCVEGPSQRQDGYLGQTFERFYVQTIALACDLVWDEVTCDEELVRFFQARGSADYDGDGAASGKDIAYNLQRNLLGFIYEYVHRLMPYLDGDFLIYEMGALGSVTAALRNGELAHEMLEGDYGLRMLLATEFFRDGKFIYDSTGYNVGNAQQVAALAEWLHGFRDGAVYKQPLDLYNDPRYRLGELLAFCRHVDCDGRVPQIGDTGGARDARLRSGAPYSAWDERALLRLTADRPFYSAQILAAAGGDVPAFRRGKADYWLIFHATDEPKSAIPNPKSQVHPSHLFPDSGIAVLRAGTRPETRWHVPFTFSKGSYGHGHTDKLALNVIASGYDLSADLGYPTTWTDAKYGGWETNTASHWTVMLDGRSQQGYATGKLGFFDTSPPVDSVEASCEAAYPGSSLYRRTLALARDAAGEPLYAVDLFRTAGAGVRDYLHHSLGKPEELRLTLAGPHGEWQTQERGTLAGEDVAFAAQPGYGFLKDVKRLAYDGAFTAEWRAGGASQPDRYLWTRADFGDFDAEFTVTRLGKASGDRERAVFVFGVDSANPGSRRQVWIDSGGQFPAGKPVRLRVEVRGGKASVALDGKPIERVTESIGTPLARGRVGFLHYYNYAYRYENLSITPVGGPEAPLKEQFRGPLDPARWERVDPTYQSGEGALLATDADPVALRLLVPGGLGAGTEVITALGEGHGLRGRSPWEAHILLRDRRRDPKAITTFASVLEVHHGTPRVTSVERLALAPAREDAAALRIVAGPYTDYVISALDPGQALTITDAGRRIEFRGRFAWLRFVDGRPAGARLVGGGVLRCGPVDLRATGLRGSIVATDVERNTLRVRFEGATGPRAGQRMLVRAPGFLAPSVYPISAATREKDGAWTVELGGMPLAVGRGRVGTIDAAAASFSSATPILKLRFNAGLFDGRRVRPADGNAVPEFRLKSATESAFVLADPAGIKSFAPGKEYVVYDVGPGDSVEVVGAAGWGGRGK